MRIPLNASTDVQTAFKEIWDVLGRVDGAKDLDLKGRKIVNSGSPTAQYDLVRRVDAERNYGFESFYVKMKQRGIDDFPGKLRDLQDAKVAIVLSTNAPKATDSGKLFFETDTGVLKFTTGSGYTTINYQGISGTDAAKPSATGLSDGVQYYATDTDTLYIVDGGSWVDFVGGAITTHVGLADPHTQYQKESEKGAASGYAALDSNTLLDEGIHYGGMYGNEMSETVTVSATDTFYDLSAGLSSGGVTAAFTFQNAHELNCNIAGTYLATWSMTVSANAAAQGLVGAVGIDATAQTNTTNHGYQATANTEVPIAGSGFITLAVDEVVTVMVANHSSTQDIDVAHVNLTLLKVA